MRARGKEGVIKGGREGRRMKDRRRKEGKEIERGREKNYRDRKEVTS